MSYIIPGDQCKYILRKCPKPLIKNTFAGALAQESSHYVTLGNSTITFFICQQFFPSFSIFFSIDTAALFSCLYHRCFALIMEEKSSSRMTYPQKETEELHLSNITKHALEESLKRLLLKKPLTKITINDLTTDCGISRMTFYYHFKDIYDLVEWACLEESTRALQGKKTYSTWQEGLLQIFEAVYENKAFIMNAYNSLSREQIENFLFRLTHDLIMGVVEERSVGTSITEAQKNFIADFYKYSFVGIMLDWIRQGMKADYTSICTDMCTTLHGNISNSIKNFTNSTE